jgi:hypothetical protein
MFSNCTRLLKAPELKATTLGNSCYTAMFSGCTSLTDAPALPSMILKDGWCYSSMFSGCTSLVNAPALPATTLTEGCYFNMFGGCTSLISIPELPATTLAEKCYQNMFNGCSNVLLSSTCPTNAYQEYRIPTVGTATMVSGAMDGMFVGTSGDVTAPNLNTTYYIGLAGVVEFTGQYADGYWNPGYVQTASVKINGKEHTEIGKITIPAGSTIELTAYDKGGGAASIALNDNQIANSYGSPDSSCTYTYTFEGTKYVQITLLTTGSQAQGYSGLIKISDDAK